MFQRCVPISVVGGYKCSICGNLIEDWEESCSLCRSKIDWDSEDYWDSPERGER